MKRIVMFGLSFIASLLLILPLQSIPVHAVSATDWQAGRIIDDGVFVNKDAMSVAEIQQFLDTKVPVCDTSGAQMTTRPKPGGGYYTRAQWGASIGYPAPYTCLKDFYEVPKSTPGPGVPANNYGGLPIPVGAVSAAQMIWDAAQTYNISPKVLLTTIQKESYGPLTVDDWPYSYQYTYAMGAQCPDGPGGAQCDPNYAGFSIQIRESARLFRYYLDNMTQPWWPYAKPGVRTVMWNVSTSTYVNDQGQTVACGGTSVNIANVSTAALYTYTPYQPNNAALNNLSGSVPAGNGFDSKCAAYGNRNFWRIFNDWFGSSLLDTCSGNESPLTYVRSFYNPRTFMHFYSAYDCDVPFLARIGYINEGPAFNTSPKDAPYAIPVYRYYNPATHQHFWTTDNLTADQLAASNTGYRQEAGIVFYVATPNMPGTHQIIRLYNPNTYLHLWSADPSPQALQMAKTLAGYDAEGPAFWAQ